MIEPKGELGERASRPGRRVRGGEGVHTPGGRLITGHPFVYFSLPQSFSKYSTGCLASSPKCRARWAVTAAFLSCASFCIQKKKRRKEEEKQLGGMLIGVIIFIYVFLFCFLWYLSLLSCFVVFCYILFCFVCFYVILIPLPSR